MNNGNDTQSHLVLLVYVLPNYNWHNLKILADQINTKDSCYLNIEIQVKCVL